MLYKLANYRTQLVQVIASKLPEFTLPERLRGGKIENTAKYLKNVYTDYKMVVVDTKQDMIDRPIRASVIVGTMAGAIYCVRHNPKQQNFQDQLVEHNNCLSRVPEPLRNKSSFDHINELFMMNNQHLLRCQSFGLFSVIYRQDYPSETDLFLAQCKFVRPSWKSYFTERIVDIGFLDRFHIMERYMIDYDINQDEFKELEKESS